MPRYAAFLRAVNVGGHGVVKKEELIGLSRRWACTDVESFHCERERGFFFEGEKGLEAKLARALETALATKSPCSSGLLEEVVAAAAHEPFPERDLRPLFRRISSDSFRRNSTPQAPRRLSSPLDERRPFPRPRRDFWWLSKHHQARPAITGRQLEKSLGEPTTLRNVNTIGGWRRGTEGGGRKRFLRGGREGPRAGLCCSRTPFRISRPPRREKERG